MARAVGLELRMALKIAPQEMATVESATALARVTGMETEVVVSESEAEMALA